MLTGSHDQALRDHHAKLDAIKRAITDPDNRRARLVHQLETTDDFDGQLIRDINARAAHLAAEREHKTAQLTELERTPPVAPCPELIDALPTGSSLNLDLARLPEPQLRHLFEAFRLQVRYDRRTHTATCRIVLAGEILAQQTSAAERALKPEQPTRPARRKEFVPIVGGAPGRIRTRGRLLRRQGAGEPAAPLTP